MLALDTVTRAEFDARLHETFELVLRDGKWPLELVEVRSLGAAAPDAKRTPFALTFRSAQPIRLPQATYRLENEHLGTLEIFIVQISPTDLEAIFN